MRCHSGGCGVQGAEPWGASPQACDNQSKLRSGPGEQAAACDNLRKLWLERDASDEDDVRVGRALACADDRASRPREEFELCMWHAADGQVADKAARLAVELWRHLFRQDGRLHDQLVHNGAERLQQTWNAPHQGQVDAFDAGRHWKPGVSNHQCIAVTQLIEQGRKARVQEPRFSQCGVEASLMLSMLMTFGSNKSTSADGCVPLCT